MKRCSALILVVSLASLQACSSSGGTDSGGTDSGGTDSGNVDSGNAESNAGSEQDNNTAVAAVLATNLPVPTSLRAAATVQEFDYAMTSVTGEPTIAKAQLFEPKTPKPPGGYPLVVWAHGTTGISNACTPSIALVNFGATTAFNALLASGYAVLAPDYEGFGTPRIHPYYQRASHANAILAAVPAAHQVTDARLSDDWAIVGHSQGGHVALVTARAQALPDYPLKAVVALAPGTDLRSVGKRAFEAIDENLAQGDWQNAFERLFFINVFSAYVAHGVAEVDAEFDPIRIFGETISPLINLAVTETTCGQYANAVQQTMNQHFTSGGTFADFQGLRRDWYTEPRVAARLEMEEMGDEFQAAPLLILQGDADRQIPIAATSDFVDRQRSLGTDVTYQVIINGRHSDVVDGEFGSVVVWLNDKFPSR